MIPARTPIVLRYAVLAALLVALALAVGAAVPRSATASVARGVADVVLTQAGPRFVPAVQEEALDQIGPGLRATYVRFVVSWAGAQPDDKYSYDTDYLAGVDHAVAEAKARGLNVIVTFSYVPRWASDSRYWYNNPFANKGYDRKYAMKTSALPAFREFSRAMAQRWQGVWGYECWNEPNLHLTLYPQSTSTVKDFGARLYVQMLKSFSAGIRAGDSQARVLAGGTAPRGYKSSDSLRLRQMMTSPQRFAATLRAAKVTSYFDGYSHHAYTPGASKNNWPEAPPRDPKSTVNLQNMHVLLKMFPTKPFYITEYGYQTAPCSSFSMQFVSPALQADYLKRAYAYAARFRQVKLLMWFMLDDFSPNGRRDDETGFYTGLRYVDLDKKPAWYAFARGNHLGLTAPASGAKGTTVTMSGALTSDTVGTSPETVGTPGPIPEIRLVVWRRTATSKPWAKIATTPATNALGAYKVTIPLTSSAYYKVEWTGVVTSPVVRIVAN